MANGPRCLAELPLPERVDADQARSGTKVRGEPRFQAIDRLAELIQSRMNAGAKLAELRVGTGAAPWKEDAGYLRDSPSYQPWREAIEEYRRQLDEDPEAL